MITLQNTDTNKHCRYHCNYGQTTIGVER